MPVTSGDTALRSLRLMIADTLHLNQDTSLKRVLFALPVFVLAYIILIVAKVNPAGFNIIWRYFGWSNQTLAVFALSCISIYLLQQGKKQFVWMPLIPLAFYAFITCSYIISAEFGLGLPLPIAFTAGGIFTVAVVTATLYAGRKNHQKS